MGWLPKAYRKPTSLGLFPYDGNLIGGAMIGIGMSATGACPGTVLVQGGTGMPQAVFIAFGGVIGAFIFMKCLPAIKAARERVEKCGAGKQQDTDGHGSSEEKAVEAATALNVGQLSFLAFWICMCFAMGAFIYSKDETVQTVPASGLVPPRYSGVLIGLAQLSTMLFTKHTLGASAEYQDIAAWMQSKLWREKTDSVTARPLLTPSVTFAAGIFFSAAALSGVARSAGFLAKPKLTPNGLVSAISNVLGGAFMLYGARAAGGCTSGHGISGLANLSLSSFATTGAMFTSGIATATALQTLGLLQF